MNKHNTSPLADGVLADTLPISVRVINETETNTVNARDLHSAMGIKQDYSNWLGNSIEEYGFLKDIEFIIIGKECALDLFVAKYLSLAERSEQGRAICGYLAQYERETGNDITSHYKIMCEALKEDISHAGREATTRDYSDESDMVYRILLGGMTAKEWALQHGYTGDPRQYMSALQLKHLSYLENANTTLIEMAGDRHFRKNELSTLSMVWLMRNKGEVYAPAL